MIGGGLAWLVVRTDVPLRGLWSWLLAMPLVVPPYVGAFVYIAYLGPRGWLWDGRTAHGPSRSSTAFAARRWC